MRLHSRTDEAYGDMPEALHRIASYRGGVMSFVPRESQADALRQITAMSRQLAANGNRRKAIVCIGAQVLCDVSEPLDSGDLSNGWLAAVSTAAQANVAVYAVVPGRLRFRGGGIVEATGGETFGGMTDLRPPIAEVWRDSTMHYLVGYWPGQKSRRLHRIEVTVSRPQRARFELDASAAKARPPERVATTSRCCGPQVAPPPREIHRHAQQNDDQSRPGGRRAVDEQHQKDDAGADDVQRQARADSRSPGTAAARRAASPAIGTRRRS